MSRKHLTSRVIAAMLTGLLVTALAGDPVGARSSCRTQPFQRKDGHHE